MNYNFCLYNIEVKGLDFIGTTVYQLPNDGPLVPQRFKEFSSQALPPALIVLVLDSNVMMCSLLLRNHNGSVVPGIKTVKYVF